MPLIKSKSKKAFSENIAAEMDAGKPQKQSLAIAYAVKKQAKRKKMAMGGEAMLKEGKPEMHDHAKSIADAIMRRRKMMAEGGMVDIEENGEEDPANPNMYDEMNEDMEDIYDDSQLDAQPMDSNEHGDDREDESQNKHDMISQIRKKIKYKNSLG